MRTLPAALPNAQDVPLPPPGLPNGVAAGDVTGESVVLWARAAETGVVTFTLQLEREGGTPLGEVVTNAITRTVVEPLLPVTATIEGLLPATTYRYQVEVANGDQASGRFRTPVGDDVHAGLRFAATGDARGDLAPYPAIINMADRDLDFFVHLGDTVYADLVSPDVPKQAQTLEEFQRKHNEVNSAFAGLNTLASLRASTVSFASIDDHEILNNFAGGALASSSRFFAESEGLINETRLYRAGMDAFLAYQPTVIEHYDTERYGMDADAAMVGRPKLYRYRTFGADGAIFVLDVRSFRSQPLGRMTNLDDDAAVAQFEQASFASDRTLLGSLQMADLQRDLLDAQARGITWKFLVTPVPMQYLDMTAAADRWQGYAFERSALLSFIVEAGITNVVFITADIHGMVVNNLTYQESAGGQQLAIPVWEIAVGPIAAHPPFGLAMFLTYLEWGLVNEDDQAHYRSLSIQHDDDDEANDRDDTVRALVDEQMARYGFNPLGLDDALPGVASDEVEIDAVWSVGDAMAGHVYGWSEFEVDAQSQQLTVTTYGIPAYLAQEMAREGTTILAQRPEVVSQFVVQPR